MPWETGEMHEALPGPRFEARTADRATVVFFVLAYKDAILAVYKCVCCENAC